MAADWTPTQQWISDQLERFAHRRLVYPPTIVRDTTDFMGIDRDDVIDLNGQFLLVTRTEQEGRFGLVGEPKFWVKRALGVATGRTHIVKLVFREAFKVQILDRQIRCERSAEKEGRVLDLVRGDGRFMQGFAERDERGNLVRVIDFIVGVDLLTWISSLRTTHEEYFHTRFPEYLAQAIACFDGIRQLHDAGLCHGDIRNDHILIEQTTGRFRWIDFDLMQNGPDFDVWALGNVLHCIAGQGLVTFQDVRRRRPELADRLHADDASVFFPNRVMNLCKIYPYLPVRLNNVLARFSAGSLPRYERVQQLVDDLREYQAELDTPNPPGSGAEVDARQSGADCRAMPAIPRSLGPSDGGPLKPGLG